MSMFCYQCQETAKGTGCTVRGVCGKTDVVSNLQDLLIYTIKGIALVVEEGLKAGVEFPEANFFVMNGLFMTITNANFDDAVIIEKIKEGLALRDGMKAKHSL